MPKDKHAHTPSNFMKILVFFPFEMKHKKIKKYHTVMYIIYMPHAP